MEFKPSIRAITQEFESYLDRTSNHVTLVEDADPFRLYFLRPSSFPYCGLRFLLEFPERRERPRLHGMASAYFTGVGTVTHSVFQRYTAKLGKIVGDWKCVSRKCGHRIQFDTYKPCPKCGSEMAYVELELAYKKTVLGHSDSLYRFTPKLGKASKHAVQDYKTTSKRRTDEDKVAEQKGNKRIFPYASNVAQIEMYIPLIEQSFGVEVDYWSLVYLARDVPFKTGRRVIVKHVKPKQKASLYKKLDRIVKIHRRVLKAASKADTDVIVKYKLCSSAEDYKKNWHDEYDPCPFQTVCFEAKALDKKLVNTFNTHKVFPIIQQAPEKVQKAMGLCQK